VENPRENAPGKEKPTDCLQVGYCPGATLPQRRPRVKTAATLTHPDVLVNNLFPKRPAHRGGSPQGTHIYSGCARGFVGFLAGMPDGTLATYTSLRVREVSPWPLALGGFRPVPTGRRPRAANGISRCNKKPTPPHFSLFDAESVAYESPGQA
jgi:hypothetical protein